MEQTKTAIKERKSLNKRQKDMIFVACLVTLPLIHYLIFYIYVNFNSILLAFQDYVPGSGRYEFNNFENFRVLFDNLLTEQEWAVGKSTILASTVKNSLIYYLFHTGVGTTATLFFSYYIFKKRFGSKLFKVILFLPSIISSIALVLMFKYFVNDALPQIVYTISGGEFDKFPQLINTNEYRFGTIVFYGIWVGFGQGLLLYSGAMANISDSVMEAAQIDGAGELRQFFSIVLPLIYPTLSTFMINAIATLFASDMHLYAFFGNGANDWDMTFGYYLIVNTREAVNENNKNLLTYSATIGIFLTIFTIPLTFFVRWLLKKLGPKTV